MHEFVKSTLTGEVRPPARSPRAWRGLLAALALWGCGEAAPPEDAAAPVEAPVATTREALTCAPSELGPEVTCAGDFTYSLECYARKSAQLCGVDTGPQTCTTYSTCEHPDFGLRRGTWVMVAGYGKYEDPSEPLDCVAKAEGHLSTLSAEYRQGVTYSWAIGGDTGPGESMKTGGARSSSLVAQYCYITFANYPVGYQSGTGPQCGTTQSSCSPACVNPKTCQVNGAWVTGSQCGTMVGPCSATSLSPVYKSCRHPDHGLAPDA